MKSKFKNKIIRITVAVMVIFVAMQGQLTPISATSGTISDDVITCNGKTYGYHGVDGVQGLHWHEAKVRADGKWGPVSSNTYWYENPCEGQVEEPSATVERSNQPKEVTAEEVKSEVEVNSEVALLNNQDNNSDQSDEIANDEEKVSEAEVQDVEESKDEEDSNEEIEEVEVAKNYKEIVVVINGVEYKIGEDVLTLSPDGSVFEISSLSLRLTDEDEEVDILEYEGVKEIPAGSSFTIYYKNGPKRDSVRGVVEQPGVTIPVINKTVPKEYLMYAGIAVGSLVVIGAGAFVIIKKKKENEEE